jgi:hypothetical protein
MSKLEKFIKENRAEFDEALPGSGVWDRIGSALPSTKRSVLKPVYKWSMAAAAVLVIGTGTYFFMQGKEKPEQPMASNEIRIDTAIKNLAPDEAPEMFRFAKMIDEKQEELKTLSREQPELYHQFIKDINHLDSSYNALQSQLKASPNREMLVEAMIQNLQLQLNVLNQQLTIIKQIKTSKTTSL